ncbi:MAG: hypothetical protein GY774_00670 [Planctomycetes bacterium]|nr:hypothetical protein [Planctomycetota bacterium]
MNITTAIKSLESVCLTTLDTSLPLQSEMGDVIAEVEKQFPESSSWELEYWLGIAIRNYTAWFIRGDERKQYLQTAILHLENAYTLSGGSQQDDIACVLGCMFIDEAVIRDLKKGVFYLKPIFDSTEDYQPAFCSYAEAYYKLGDYAEAIHIGLELNRRAKRQEWHSGPPTAPMNTVSKSYRVLAKDSKKKGKIEAAISLFQTLINLGLATDNDKELLKKLQGEKRR